AAAGVRHRRGRRPRPPGAGPGGRDPGLRTADLAARPGPGHAGRTGLSGRDHFGRLALPPGLIMLSRSLALALVAALAATPVLGQRAPAEPGDMGRLQAEHHDEQVRARRLRADARRAAADVERLRRELVTLARAQGADEREVAEQRARLNRLNARESAL